MDSDNWRSCSIEGMGIAPSVDDLVSGLCGNEWHRKGMAHSRPLNQYMQERMATWLLRC